MPPAGSRAGPRQVRPGSRRVSRGGFAAAESRQAMAPPSGMVSTVRPPCVARLKPAMRAGPAPPRSNPAAPSSSARRSGLAAHPEKTPAKTPLAMPATPPDVAIPSLAHRARRCICRRSGQRPCGSPPPCVWWPAPAAPAAGGEVWRVAPVGSVVPDRDHRAPGPRPAWGRLPAFRRAALPAAYPKGTARRGSPGTPFSVPAGQSRHGPLAAPYPIRGGPWCKRDRSRPIRAPRGWPRHRVGLGARTLGRRPGPPLLPRAPPPARRQPGSRPPRRVRMVARMPPGRAAPPPPPGSRHPYPPRRIQVPRGAEPLLR